MRIALLGDIALIGLFDYTRSKDVLKRIEPIRQLVSDCDYVICNLESPLTNKTKTMICKGAYLRADPCNVEVLKAIGITHVTLANNHVFDYGKQGAKDTISALEKNGIFYCGLNNEPLLLSKDDDHALLDGFCCYSANGVYYGKKPLSIQTLSLDNLKSFFEESASKKCLPIASVHFGIERLHYPANEHINLFHDLSSKYSFILHGNHTHCIQGYEKNKNSLLIYSQGNLLFDDVLTTSIGSPVKQTDESRKTYIMKIEYSKGIIQNYEAIPLQFDCNGYVIKEPSILDELEAYSNIIIKSPETIKVLRNQELAKDNNKKNKNFVFVLKRLNIKYIASFINDRIHKTKYNKLFENYMENNSL